MNKQNVKRNATIHQYYSILASRDASSFSFSNPKIIPKPGQTTESIRRDQQPVNKQHLQPISHSSSTLITHTIPLIHQNHFNSKPTTNNSEMSQEEIRNLYDKAWKWFIDPFSLQSNQNVIKM